MQPAKSAPAELVHTKSMLRRAQNRADDLRRMFQLPSTEHLIDEFMCALRKKVLLQGRMYLFREHVCFHCNLFGYQKTKCIPLAGVVEVRKKKNVGFPNSIELTLESGKREFFTSFLAREEAYRLIMNQWRHCSEHAPPTPEPDAVPEVAGRSRSVSRLLRGMSSLVHREGSCSRDTPEPGAFGLGVGAPLEALHEEGSVGDASGSGGCSSLAGDPGGAGHVPGAGEATAETSHPSLLQDNSFVSWASFPAGAGEGPATPGVSRGGASGDGDAGAAADGGDAGPLTYEFQALTDLQCQKELELEVALSEPAPPVPPTMQLVLEFDLPCPPLEFWSRFLANHSNWLHKFHASRGDSSIRVSKWQRHFKVGMVRDVQFVHPVKARIGPPQAVCHQTQRLKVFARRHLVLETSQVMSDIPYADHFSVETRWDVAPAKGGSRVTVHIQVPFSKKTMWQRFIEKGSFDDTLEMVQGWRQMASQNLAADPSTGLTPGGSEPHSEAEWNLLLSRVDPHYRGAVQHLRRHSRAGSISQQGGVHVGRQLPVLARHRRNASRSDGAGRGSPVGHHTHLGSPSRPSSRAASFRNLEQLVEQLVEQQAEQPKLTTQQQQQQERQQQPKRPLLVATVLALVGWLLSLLRAGARTFSSKQSAAWACCAAIIAIQAAVILQQHHQLARLQQQQGQGAALVLPADSAEGSSGQQVALAAAALGHDVAQMQDAMRQLQVQLDSALSTAADLARRLQKGTAAAISGGT